MNIKRGDIFLAALDPVIGREISKTRPVVVVSNDKNNRYAETITVLPLTSQNLEKTYPFEVFIEKGAGNLPKNSKVKTDQIRTLDRKRLVKHIGKFDEDTVTAIGSAIRIHLNL